MNSSSAQRTQLKPQMIGLIFKIGYPYDEGIGSSMIGGGREGMR